MHEFWHFLLLKYYTRPLKLFQKVDPYIVILKKNTTEIPSIGKKNDWNKRV